MDPSTQKRIADLEKLRDYLTKVEQHPQLPIFEVLQEISSALKVLAGKEALPVEHPAVQKIAIDGVDMLTIQGKPGENGETPSDEKIISLIKPLIPEVKDGKTPTAEELVRLMKPLIPVPKNGEDGISPDPEILASEAAKIAIAELFPSIPTVEEIQNKLPILGERIRDALELLSEEEKLKMSAIENLDATLKTLQNRTQLLNQIQGGLQRQIDALSIGGSGLTKETPTGTINDANLTFTVAHEPFFINVNGLIYQVGDGLYASYAGGTITLNSPVGTGGFIKSYY